MPGSSSAFAEGLFQHLLPSEVGVKQFDPQSDIHSFLAYKELAALLGKNGDATSGSDPSKFDALGRPLPEFPDSGLSESQVDDILYRGSTKIKKDDVLPFSDVFSKLMGKAPEKNRLANQKPATWNDLYGYAAILTGTLAKHYHTLSDHHDRFDAARGQTSQHRLKKPRQHRLKPSSAATSTNTPGLKPLKSNDIGIYGGLGNVIATSLLQPDCGVDQLRKRRLMNRIDHEADFLDGKESPTQRNGKRRKVDGAVESVNRFSSKNEDFHRNTGSSEFSRVMALASEILRSNRTHNLSRSKIFTPNRVTAYPSLNIGNLGTGSDIVNTITGGEGAELPAGTAASAEPDAALEAKNSLPDAGAGLPKVHSQTDTARVAQLSSKLLGSGAFTQGNLGNTSGSVNVGNDPNVTPPVGNGGAGNNPNVTPLVGNEGVGNNPNVTPLAGNRGGSPNVGTTNMDVNPSLTRNAREAINPAIRSNVGSTETTGIINYGMPGAGGRSYVPLFPSGGTAPDATLPIVPPNSDGSVVARPFSNTPDQQFLQTVANNSTPSQQETEQGSQTAAMPAGNSKGNNPLPVGTNNFGPDPNVAPRGGGGVGGNVMVGRAAPLTAPIPGNGRSRNPLAPDSAGYDQGLLPTISGPDGGGQGRGGSGVDGGSDAANDPASSSVSRAAGRSLASAGNLLPLAAGAGTNDYGGGGRVGQAVSQGQVTTGTGYDTPQPPTDTANPSALAPDYNDPSPHANDGQLPPGQVVAAVETAAGAVGQQPTTGDFTTPTGNVTPDTGSVGTDVNAGDINARDTEGNTGPIGAAGDVGVGGVAGDNGPDGVTDADTGPDVNITTGKGAGTAGGQGSGAGVEEGAKSPVGGGPETSSDVANEAAPDDATTDTSKEGPGASEGEGAGAPQIAGDQAGAPETAGDQAASAADAGPGAGGTGGNGFDYGDYGEGSGKQGSGEGAGQEIGKGPQGMDGQPPPGEGVATAEGTGAAEGAGAAARAGGDAVGGVADAVKGAANEGGNALRGAGGAVSTAAGAVGDAVEAVGDGVSEASGVLADAEKALGDAADEDVVGDAVGDAANAIGDAAATIGEGLDNSGEATRDALSDRGSGEPDWWDETGFASKPDSEESDYQEVSVEEHPESTRPTFPIPEYTLPSLRDLPPIPPPGRPAVVLGKPPITIPGFCDIVPCPFGAHLGALAVHFFETVFPWIDQPFNLSRIWSGMLTLIFWQQLAALHAGAKTGIKSGKYGYAFNILTDYQSDSIIRTDINNSRLFACKGEGGRSLPVDSSFDGPNEFPLTVHPQIEFRQPQNMVHVKLEDMATHEVLWDATYNLHGSRILSGNARTAISGAFESDFNTICPDPTDSGFDTRRYMLNVTKTGGGGLGGVSSIGGKNSKSDDFIGSAIFHAYPVTGEPNLQYHDPAVSVLSDKDTEIKVAVA